MQDTNLLQAINTMLSCIGEAPVSSLDSGLPTDAVIAQNILEETSREVQARKWWFNTLTDQKLVKQSNGKVAVPTNWATVDHDDYNYIKRGGFLYDLDKATDVFTADVTGLEAVIWLDFADIPEPVRSYVIIRASRLFFERMIGESSRAAMLQNNESQAYLSIQQYDSDQSDLNIFNNTFVNLQRRRF